jgi:hypothetical protein
MKMQTPKDKFKKFLAAFYIFGSKGLGRRA